MTIIDTKTGDLKFDTFVLGRTARQADLEKFVTKHSPSYTSQQQLLALGSHTAEGKLWGLGAAVRNDRVVQFWLQHLDADGIIQDAWDINNEMRRQKAHDDYMRTICDEAGTLGNSVGTGRRWQFNWGSISSALDLKGVQALLVIDYPF